MAVLLGNIVIEFLDGKPFIQYDSVISTGPFMEIILGLS